MASRTNSFEDGFNGELLLDEGSVKIGRAPGGAAPYDMPLRRAGVLPVRDILRHSGKETD